ncbi:hypothetical protein [Streptomyces fructofermentans]|uniref:Uncharacterized protein n=1 Tax=Streptomyces fructofermentans TaxID=152141 RepID=A0A918NC37_9ACTN|nr:hypothetical protein [Streptomyces fructofermentans]GGX56855.1 hypothetical protein GCM10010515_25440 [Streptomyces fructofermentans]
MPASPHSRPAPTGSGAVRPGTRTRIGATAVAALALAGTALVAAPTAFAAPGDNGDVKIHAETTAPTDQRNDPKVCKFHLAAFNFDTVQGVTWLIEPQPARRGGATLNGNLTLTTGAGNSELLTLPDGQYKLTWKIEGGLGAGKQKVFKVDCKAPPAGGPNGGGPNGGGPNGGGPNGGPPAGGGGLAETPGVSAIGATAAIGLIGVSGFAYVRMLRRRPDGAA